MSHPSLKTLLALCLAVALSACKKKGEPPAVIEEVPPSPAVETDSTATLSEEPDLKKVGEPSATKSAPAHPSSMAAEAAGFSDHGHFVVQVSVFKSRRQAARLMEKLANEGYPAYVAEVESPTTELAGTYHRVRIGKFGRIADARAFGDNTLKPLGYDFWVDNKKNDQVGMAGGGGSFSSEPPPRAQPAEPVTTPSEPSVPSEPSEPASSGSWGTPKDEPAAPASSSWGTPKDEPAAEKKPAAKAAKTEPKPAATPAAAPADTGKVNLDEW